MAGIALARWGSFHVGGREVRVTGQAPREVLFTPGGAPALLDPNGTYLVGAMYAQFMRPEPCRFPVPLLLWHGGGLTGACWETTPDGREGWQHVFLRAGWEVVVSDAVERGRAGWMRIPEETGGAPVMLTLENPWERFRIGPGTPQQGRVFEGQQFPADPDSWRASARRWWWRTARAGISLGGRRRNGRPRCGRWCCSSRRRWCRAGWRGGGSAGEAKASPAGSGTRS
jgi:hypothetical protein